MFKKCLATVLILSLWACAPNEGSERKQWEHNSKALLELGHKYPSFKPLAEQQLAEATKAWEEATREGDEKARAEKMNAVNDLAMKVLYPVTGYEMHVKKLNDLIKDRRLNNLPAGKVVPLVKQAYAALESSESKVLRGQAASPEALKELLKKAEDDLSKAERPLKQLLAKK